MHLKNGDPAKFSFATFEPLPGQEGLDSFEAFLQSLQLFLEIPFHPINKRRRYINLTKIASRPLPGAPAQEYMSS